MEDDQVLSLNRPELKLTDTPGHVWRVKWTALIGPLSQGDASSPSLLFVTGPRTSVSLKLSDTRVYEFWIRARLGNHNTSIFRVTWNLYRSTLLERNVALWNPRLIWCAAAGWMLVYSRPVELTLTKVVKDAGLATFVVDLHDVHAQKVCYYI